MAASRIRVLVRVGIAATTVAPQPNWSSSSAPTTSAPSRSSTTTSTPSTSTPWQSLASLFSSLSSLEGTGSYSQNPTTTNWLFIDRPQVIAAIYERLHPDWQSQGKCWGSCTESPANLFYAEYQYNNSQVQEAKSVCLGTHPDHPGRCPVLDRCLDYAIQNGERYGVWGGCSERERRRIKRQRHRDAALQNGNIIPLASPGHRPGAPDAAGDHEEGDPTPWGHSKALIAVWRAQRAAG